MANQYSNHFEKNGESRLWNKIKKNMVMKFSKRTSQNDKMGKKGTCISEGKYLEIEQCISLCSYIMLIFIVWWC